MKKLLLVLFIPSLVNASPYLVSDPTVEEVTHCGYILDSNDKVDSPVEVVTEGKRCHIDLAGLPVGNHTIKATFANIDPVWGRSESAESAPFSLVRPTVELTVTPSGLVLIK